nr:unnamed protein product [Arabidopsis thaliana]
MSEMTAATISPSFNANVKQNKPPSFPSESSNRRPKTRDVASRYLGGTSSFFHQSSPKRCQSPIVTRPVTPSSVATNRPQSTPRRESLDRREVSKAERMLLTSGRSLFASFQADSFTPGTLERRKTTSSATISKSGGGKQEKLKLSDQWPRSLQPSCLSSRSVDFTDTRKKLIGSGNGVARALQDSMVSNRPVSRERITSVDLETESVSSGSSNGRGKMLPARGNVVKARVSQDRLEPSSHGLRKISVDSSVLSPKEANCFQKVSRFDLLHLVNLRRLYNAWRSISNLYNSVSMKRIEMQHLKQNLKLISILNMQMGHLEEWLVIDRNYMGSLVGAAEALKGSTLCLPVDCGAMVNVQSVKDAICSAVDVMQAMASSICLLLPKVGKISSLAAELGRVNAKDEGMLDVCRDLLNTISALQVQYLKFIIDLSALYLQCWGLISKLCR